MRAGDDRRVLVAVTATGHPLYGLSARQTVRSVLDHTPFGVVVGCDEANASLVPRSDRVRLVPVEHRAGFRAEPFLTKFTVWRRCLDEECEIVVHLDADAVIVAPLDETDLERALGDRHLAMVEQRGITGSTMDRASFLEHYLEHSHRYLVPLLPEPSLDRFRFHNSGVIVFRRSELRNLVDWYDELRLDRPDHHAIGEHMIADQDYLQVWTNVVRPDACADLDPRWNHCPWWDDDFPSPDARIVHLSNFCNGPPLQTALALQRFRRSHLPARPTESWADLSFCLVTHRSGAVIGDCLDALAQFEGAEIVVVDNASDDDTVARVAERGVEVHCSPVNTGFAAAANRASRSASRPVLVFVNPDCFVHLDALDGVVDRLPPDEAVALVADYVHADGDLVTGLRPGYTWTRLARDVAGSTPAAGLVDRLAAPTALDDHSWNWPLAACLAIRRDLFERIGGFDETYFLYMEDVELGRSLHAVGGAVAPLGATVVHLGRQGADMDDEARDRLIDRARIVYAARHHGPVRAAALRGIRLVDGLVEAGRGLRRRRR